MNMMKEATIAIIICCESAYDEIPHTFESQDCGAAIQNILLKALDLGYGSCWCGIYPDKERVDKFSSLLHLNNVPIAAIALGKTNEVVKTRGFYDENKVTYIK